MVLVAGDLARLFFLSSVYLVFLRTLRGLALPPVNALVSIKSQKCRVEW